MRFTISLLFTFLFSIAGNAMDDKTVAESAPIRLVPTIETEKTQQDTRIVFEQFQSTYQKTIISDSRGVLPPWGLSQTANPRIESMHKRKANGNIYLDQLAYQNDMPIAYINFGQMPVKEYTKAGHPKIAHLWHQLNLTNESEEMNENVGIGYVAFGFATNIHANSKEAVIKETLSFMRKATSDGKLLPIQNRLPTHFVSVVSFEDKALVSLLGKTGFTIYDIEKDNGYPKFDSDTEQRTRVFALLKI